MVQPSDRRHSRLPRWLAHLAGLFRVRSHLYCAAGRSTNACAIVDEELSHAQAACGGVTSGPHLCARTLSHSKSDWGRSRVHNHPRRPEQSGCRFHLRDGRCDHDRNQQHSCSGKRRPSQEHMAGGRQCSDPWSEFYLQGNRNCEWSGSPGAWRHSLGADAGGRPAAFTRCRSWGGCICNCDCAALMHEALPVKAGQEGRRETAFLFPRYVSSRLTDTTLPSRGAEGKRCNAAHLRTKCRIYARSTKERK